MLWIETCEMYLILEQIHLYVSCLGSTFIYIYNVCMIYVYISYLGVKYISFTIIDFVWGLLVTT